MFLIGLTGGIASGKSTVATFFRDLGVSVIDADTIAREVVEPNKPAWKLIVKHFGEEILLADGHIDRPKLGAIIFADNAKRRLLNSCTHPYIQREMVWQALMCLLKGEHYAVLDVPLLYEGSQLLSVLNQVIVVYCDKETQLSRLMSRNNLTQEEALQRINSQMPLEKKCDLADHVIDNNGRLACTKEKIAKMNVTFQNSWQHWKLRGVILATLLGLGAALYSMLTFMG